MKTIKFVTIAGIGLGGLLLLLAWSQSWGVYTLEPGAPVPALPVTGQTVAPALSAFAFATVALAVALLLAGPFFRMLLAVLLIGLAGCAAYSSIYALADPVTAGMAAVTSATGVSGQRSVQALVASVATTPWPWIAIAASFILGAFAVLVIVTNTAWPASSRRHQPVRMEPADPSDDNARDAASAWDELTRGDDPTRK